MGVAEVIVVRLPVDITACVDDASRGITVVQLVIVILPILASEHGLHAPACLGSEVVSGF